MGLSRIKWSNLEDQLRYGKDYTSLLLQGIMVGRDLAVTNVRTGARKSADLNTTTEVAANVADEFILNNRLYAYSAMNGATNLVSTVLTDWTDAGAAVSSQVSVGLYRITLTAGAGSVLYAFASAANNRNLMCQARLVSGTVPATSIATFRGASTPLGTPFDLTTLTSSFQDVNPTVTSASTSDDVIFSLASGTCVIELQYIRAVDFLVKHPAFPDGSVAGASYGDDLLVCTPTWGGSGTIIQGAISYGWSGNDSPFTHNAGMYNTTNNFYGWVGNNSSGLNFSGSLFAPSAVFDAAGLTTATNVCAYTWNSTNITARHDSENKVSQIESVSPSGNLSIGNDTGGTEVSHIAAFTILFNRILNDAEYNTLRVGIVSDFATFGGFR